MAKNKPLKKQSATLQDNKIQNRNVENKGTYTPAY